MQAWIYNGKELNEVPTKAVSFVYLIENMTNGKLYVGKKSFYSTTRKAPLKGMKRKRVVTVESDWRSYTGSSTTLNDDIAAGANITKTILHICGSKGSASYLELKEQIDRKVLLDDRYYNNFIGAKIHGKHLTNFNMKGLNEDARAKPETPTDHHRANI